MTQRKYDITSPESLLEFARGLSGKTLAEVIGLPQSSENIKNKGSIGNMVEEYHYQYRPDNLSGGPDFAEAKVELKVTGVIKRYDGSYRAKERLVLMMINYINLVKEEWEDSSLMEKCRLMLILFYLYDKNFSPVNRRFVLNPILFEFPKDDLIIIKRDWEIIRGKVKNGKAHELSEGDTYYLGACRKGSGGPKELLKRQPFSDILAKSRAFSLKTSYVNKIIQGHTSEVSSLGVSENVDIEQATQNKFKPYLGKTVTEISKILNFYKQGKNDKGFYRNLTMRMMGFSGKKSVPELEKAGIEIKTIRLGVNGKPKEAMSFPGFKYMEIIKEEWEDSVFFEKIEKRFLFVVFRFEENSELRLLKVMYWNMPFRDREEARRVWHETKNHVAIDARYLPQSKDSWVAHIRPKAKNSKDVILTPQGTYLPKKCFWLNREYIASVVNSDI